MDRLGLVGLPNSGKSALFNALTGGDTLVAPHPFSTTETEVGVAHVPDARLDALAKMSESKKVVPAAFEVVDIAGVRKSGETGEGLSSRFLAGAREVDALAFVLRAFDDDAVAGETDPLVALETIEIELAIADASSLENQLGRKRRPDDDASHVAALAAAPAALEQLQNGVPLYRSSLDAEHMAALRPLFLLTAKPVLAVINLGEDQIDDGEKLIAAVAEHLGSASEVLGVSVQLEAEAARLAPEDRRELLEGLGLGEGVLHRLAEASWRILGRQTFLTTGDKESRAWMFRSGAKAPECAGVIHSDLQRGFIKADVIHWDELLEAGSFAAARAKGKVRLEGKDYVVKDGDVLEIRFNV